VSTALMEAPATLFAAGPRAAGPRRTLEDVLEDSWRSALRDGRTECPVCTATMHADGPQASCTSCGSTLS
jgi:5-methylcytosine-specific restriction endonuclease McrA